MGEIAFPPASALLKERDYLRFWACRCASEFGAGVESITIGWQIYILARRGLGVEQSAFLVGMVGLASFAPLFLLALTAGEMADRHSRKAILKLCFAVEIVVAAGLALASGFHVASIRLVLAAAVVFGAARAFYSPANTALGTMLVPRELLPRAIAWNSLATKAAGIAGPAAGGLLVAVSPALAYAVAAGLYGVSIAAMFLIRHPARPMPASGSRLTLIKEGLVYIWEAKTVFGAISLDLFAVLLGGATALLPVFARDVLHVGAVGFGILRGAPAVGAGAVAIFLASHPIRRWAGAIMFGGVAVFGAATLVFGLSNWLWLSVAALAIVGAADMISVFVRATLVQLATPDPMRGRVAAVSGLFISGSNELGEFESGVTARFLGPVGAAVLGGVGALIVTGLWAKLFPALRKADRVS